MSDLRDHELMHKLKQMHTKDERPVVQEHQTHTVASTHSSKTSIRSLTITFAVFRLHQNLSVSFSLSFRITHTGVKAAWCPYAPYPDAVYVYRTDIQLCNR